MEIVAEPKIVSPIAGRKPDRLKFKNLERAITLIDGNLEKAIMVLIDGLTDADPDVRFKCANALIKKAIPDRKVKEIGGIGGGPIKTEHTDRRLAIFQIVKMLDEVSVEQVKNGEVSFRQGEEETTISITENRE